ncbi:MAG: hypothetical protein ACFE8M_09385 [Candidatus Hermodarchaeota archaeon]
MSNLVLKKELIKNNIFLVIPSWGKLLGYPTLGQYANHDVLKISQDLVIFFGGIESAVKTFRGTIYYLFGIGYYYTKFEVQAGRYITDSRPLTGLLLSDFVYDRLAKSKNITLQNDRDVVVGEDVFKIPIDLSFKSENKKTFIRGILMRNLFIPYKDIILEFMNSIRDPNIYKFDNTGHMILSTHWDFFNKILISDDMQPKMKLKYLESVAGLNGISLRVYKFLIEHFTNSELLEIKEIIRKLKEAYSTVEFDPMYLYSLIDQANIWLKIKIPNSVTHQVTHTPKGTLKETILVSADENLASFVEWPDQFRRRTKKELEDSVLIGRERLYHPREEEKTIVKEEPKRETFEPRFIERPTVEIKILPEIPTSNIIEILLVLKDIINQDYDLRSIGKAFEIARNYIKSMVLHLNYLWDLSKYANIYQRAKPNLGLSYKEKLELLEKIDTWIDMSK